MRQIIISIWAINFIKKVVFLQVIFLILFAGKSQAQNNDMYGFEDIQGLFDVNEQAVLKYASNREKPNNEMEFILATGFNTYKAFFSSQDNPSCIFYPSCSVYSVEAFQKKGVFLGIVYTFDRLSRCHRLVKANEYIYSPEKQRFYDPIE